jgi:hypothetical protein
MKRTKYEGQRETEENADCRLQNDEPRMPPSSSPLRRGRRMRERNDESESKAQVSIFVISKV